MADSFDSEKPHRDAGNDIIGHFGLPITFDNRLLVFFFIFFPLLWVKCCQLPDTGMGGIDTRSKKVR